MENTNVREQQNHYDVGIFGVWSGCNYGSIATYYALNQVISSMGKTVLMIDKPILSDSDVELKETHARRFGREHYNISKQYRLEQMHLLNNICDAFMIGSDQVWNYGISKNFGKAFYLDFAGEEKKKIAYAVSFGHGTDFAPVDERKVIAEYMSYFDGIGTREADGVRLCREYYGIKAEQVLDPVFVADPKIYDSLIEKSSHKEEESFIAAYILDPTPEKTEAILHLQKEFGGMKVINLLDGLPWLFEKNKKLTNLPNCIENVQVEDWLYYLKNAQFVLTDSCHGASFALIFKKNFIAITNRHRGFSRFVSLSQLFKFEDHLITDPKVILSNPDLLTPINYGLVDDIMDLERRRCNKWLTDVLEQPKKREEDLKKQNIIGEISTVTTHIIEKPKNGVCDEKTVLKVVGEKNCSGCGACESICPKGAIILVKNSEGFLIPSVNRNKCVTCGLCLRKCTSAKMTYNGENDRTEVNQVVRAKTDKAVVSRINRHMCMGCGACVSVCPYKAIELKADSMGYYRFCVDYQKCVNCGMCTEVCPAYKLPENKNEKSPVCYAFIAADDNVLRASSSGGAFPVLADTAFARDGIVVGAAWKDDFSVEHIMISEKRELHKLQKSKYLQSYLGDTFKRIKEKVEENIFVLFSGCPCQVAGLKAFLKRDYDNLILVDLLCGNSPSTLFFQKYIEDSFPEGVKKYEFRHKVEGWNSDCVSITVTDGTSIVRRGGSEDDYQRVYHNHTMCASHCENCRYQTAPRIGDLTIGDFWGIGKRDKTIDTQKGVSVILCNNEKGRNFFESVKQEEFRLKQEVPLGWLGGNGYAINGSHNYCSPQRDAFYSAIGKMPFGKAVNYALKPNHGIYQKADNLSPLCYNSKALHFNFDRTIWEEHYIKGVTCLLVKVKKAPVGRYATLPLNQALIQGKNYILKARFRIKTESRRLNFHIKDSGSNYNQVIYSHVIKNNSEWEEIEIAFKPRSNIYDEFMFGASQVTGDMSFLAIDYIEIIST